MATPPSRHNQPHHIIGLLMIGASIFILAIYFLPSGQIDSASISPAKPDINIHSKSVQDVVNKHLVLTSQKSQLSQQKMHLENELKVRSINRIAPSQPYQANSGLGLEHHEGQTQVAPPTLMPTDPNQLIQAKILEEEKGREYTEAYKKEYARQFIENARRNGWEVQLNEDFKVISVRPIKNNTQQMQLFAPEN